MVDDLKYGFVVPFGDAAGVAELAALGEEHGWDALFVAEGVWGVDAWVTLTAAALATQRLRVGTLDRLSHGRVVLGAGLGALHEGWTAFERDEGRATRVTKLEEGLAIYDGLMRGQPFSFDGELYQVSADDVRRPRSARAEAAANGVARGCLRPRAGEAAVARARRTLGRAASSAGQPGRATGGGARRGQAAVARRPGRDRHPRTCVP